MTLYTSPRAVKYEIQEICQISSVARHMTDEISIKGVLQNVI